jgi:hypothetical protein
MMTLDERLQALARRVDKVIATLRELTASLPRVRAEQELAERNRQRAELQLPPV